MEWILVLFAFLVFVIIFIKSNSPANTQETPSYRQVEAFLTPAERSFYGVLKQVTPSEFTVMAKVRIADVLLPQKGMARKEWQVAFNKISAKHFDFVICDNGTMQVLAAIELDDKSHRNHKTKKRDVFVETACSSAALPLLRFQAKRAYQPEDVKVMLQGSLPTTTVSPTVNEQDVLEAS